MKNPIIYVLLNGELNMSAGKAAAQSVHAAMMLNAKSKKDFLSDFKRTVIVLEAKSSDQIKNLYTYLDDTKVDANYYIDEGHNEVAPYSVTALAVFVGDDEELREMLEDFPLYRGPKVNEYEEARRLLKDIRWGLVDGLEDNSPWVLRRTIKWLGKNKK